MSTDLIFPTQVVLAFVTIGLLARWYVAPRLAGLPRESALQPLLVVQTFRYIGLVDFANAFVQARSASVISDLGAAYYIPIVIVPAAVVSHVMILSLLLRRSGNRLAS